MPGTVFFWEGEVGVWLGRAFDGRMGVGGWAVEMGVGIAMLEVVGVLWGILECGWAG